MDANQQMALVDGFILCMGTLFFVLGLRARWRDAAFARSGVPGTAKVVDKRVKTYSSEDGNTELYYLKCVLVEGGELVSSPVEVNVNRETWDVTQIDQDIEVYQINRESGDIRMRTASGTRLSGAHIVLLIGIAGMAFGAYRLFHDLAH